MKIEVFSSVPKSVQRLLNPAQITLLGNTVHFEYAEAVQEEIQKEAPKKTGALRKSITIFPRTVTRLLGTKGKLKVFTDSPYGRIRNEGTGYLPDKRPTRKGIQGVIVPKNAKALRWMGGDGKPVFAKWVYQEGTGYFDKGAKAAWNRRVATLKKTAGRVLKAMGFK